MVTGVEGEFQTHQEGERRWDRRENGNKALGKPV